MGKPEEFEIVVVTGTRRWHSDARDAIRAQFDAVTARTVFLYHGGATGIDSVAKDEGQRRGWHVRGLSYIDALGKRGGPARNREMCGAARALSRFLACRITGIAFPDADSRGTYDCVRALKDIGVTARVVAVGSKAPDADSGAEES